MNRSQASSGDLKNIHTTNDFSALSKPQRPNPLKEDKDQEHLFISISPMPTGAERIAALRDLGATFEESNCTVAKVATPTGTAVPSFLDSNHLEAMLQKEEKDNIVGVSKEVIF